MIMQGHSSVDNRPCGGGYYNRGSGSKSTSLSYSLEMRIFKYSNTCKKNTVGNERVGNSSSSSRQAGRAANALAGRLPAIGALNRKISDNNPYRKTDGNHPSAWPSML